MSCRQLTDLIILLSEMILLLMQLSICMFVLLLLFLKHRCENHLVVSCIVVVFVVCHVAVVWFLLGRRGDGASTAILAVRLTVAIVLATLAITTTSVLIGNLINDNVVFVSVCRALLL